MPWRVPSEFDAGRIPPALGQIEPLICIAYEAFASLCVVDGLDGEWLLLRIRHLGGAKMQTTLGACLQRELDFTLPHQYQVVLRDAGAFGACLAVRACAGVP